MVVFTIWSHCTVDLYIYYRMCSIYIYIYGGIYYTESLYGGLVFENQ